MRPCSLYIHIELIHDYLVITELGKICNRKKTPENKYDYRMKHKNADKVTTDYVNTYSAVVTMTTTHQNIKIKNKYVYS